ncbi:SRPBCC family protein [Anabaena sp. FACHB-1237]|uniref:SRPBCC family protein n=1 Tax=Anabaena sp. FACHB-1237 TaxID=2692769 RepID=UPI0016800A62|nr:SRPBCC family protein [Anabaena sp. FACHB-1237]MBD2137479.1 SRPBCC family protein [Anabaena sp. FACHB-1237]
MTSSQILEQSVIINTSSTIVEQCITELHLMHQWLNPVLRCEPVDEIWSTEVGSHSRFIIQVPLLYPTLNVVVVERQPGLIVWGFEGFFQGCDRWECQPLNDHTLLPCTLLINRFEYSIPNPIISWGFNKFALSWTQKDMEAQLQRLKQVAERPH